MKKQLLSAALLLVLLFPSCKKDEEEDIPQIGNYVENEALVESGASVYFICDVEGLAGTTKINYQRTTPPSNVGSSWGTFICYPGYDGFTSSCDLLNNGQFIYNLDFHFMGKCPDCKWADVVKTGDLELATPDKLFQGAAIWLQTPDQKVYYSDSTSASERANNEIEVISLEPNSDAFPSHYATIRFTCTLKSSDGETIRLKNAVARVFTDDMI